MHFLGLYPLPNAEKFSNPWTPWHSVVSASITASHLLGTAMHFSIPNSGIKPAGEWMLWVIFIKERKPLHLLACSHLFWAINCGCWCISALSASSWCGLISFTVWLHLIAQPVWCDAALLFHKHFSYLGYNIPFVVGFVLMLLCFEGSAVIAGCRGVTVFCIFNT